MLDLADVAWLHAIPVTTVEVRLVPRWAWRPPPNPSVTFRSALGLAMLDAVCVRDDRHCRACIRSAECLVPAWYEPNRAGGNGPRPFTLRASWERDALEVSLRFLGPIPESSTVFGALVRAAHVGLGQHRVPFVVERIGVRGETDSVIVSDEQIVGPWPRPAPLSRLVRVPQDARGARLHLRQVRLSREGPMLLALLWTAVFRMREIGVPRSDRDWPIQELPCRWLAKNVRASRWSKNQQENIDLSGWTGIVEVEDGLGPVADLLAAAEVVGLGQNTSCGGGQIEIEWL